MSNDPAGLAADLLVDDKLAFGDLPLVEGDIADVHGLALADVKAALADLERRGLIRKLMEDAGGGNTYGMTPEGMVARERVLAARGLRHHALARQRDFAIGDLVLAVIKSMHIFNARLTGGALGTDTTMNVRELGRYLWQYTHEEVTTACTELAQARFVQERVHARITSDHRFELGALGHKAYDTRIARALGIAKNASVIDPVLDQYIRLFFAWQSEYKPARNKIGSVLDALEMEFSNLPGVVKPLQIVVAAGVGDGAVRIDQQLLDRIRECEFFVGDLTAVFVNDRRLHANDNVLVEVGYALASKDAERVLLVAEKRRESEFTEGNPQLAFDIRNVRRHEFESKEGLKTTLRAELEAALRKCGWLH